VRGSNQWCVGIYDLEYYILQTWLCKITIVKVKGYFFGKNARTCE
jgi:hypothetical protein